MRLRVASSILFFNLLAFGQTTEQLQFLAADVHLSVKNPNQNPNQNQFMRTSNRGERYELKTATMVDLIGVAYNSNAIKILGGPNWLEMDRFDVIAKQPPQTSPDTQKLMLRSPLADRFK